jgi:hypothetical protein
VEARTRPSSPSPRTAAGSATRNATGWATSSGTSKNSQPQNSVAVSEYSPIDAVAIVRGTMMSRSGGGTAIEYSSTPCHRCHWIAPPEPNSVDDQIPIIPAPSAT